MIYARNRRHAIELVAWIMFGIVVLFNINSIAGGAGKLSNQMGDSTASSVISIADMADNLQHVTENGILQAAIYALFGSDVSTYTTESVDYVVIEPSVTPVETRHGNIGEWIQTAGGWVVGLMTLVTGDLVEVSEETAFLGEFTVATHESAHIRRPVVTHVPLQKQDEDLVIVDSL